MVPFLNQAFISSLVTDLCMDGWISQTRNKSCTQESQDSKTFTFKLYLSLSPCIGVNRPTCLVWAKPGLFLFIFVPFLNTMTDKYSTKFDYKSVDGVLGIWTERMVSADESTELWRHPLQAIFSILCLSVTSSFVPFTVCLFDAQFSFLSVMLN